MLFKQKFGIYLIFCMALSICSCKKYLDINTDPNNPTAVGVSKLLPAAERSLGESLSVGGSSKGGLSELLEPYIHRMSTREEPNQYNVHGTDFFLETSWPGLYKSVLTNLDLVINDSTNPAILGYSGVAKILKAYTFSQLVDVFGDVPFTETGKLIEGLRYPKFDDDAEIYPALFTLLDDGIADLNAATLFPGTDDVIYGGDKDLWIKAANTIKLKLYTQTRKVQDVSAQVTQLLSAPDNLINATDESFLLPFGASGSTDDRNPGFGDYFAAQRSNHVSPWFYEILKGYNPNIFRNIADPRVPYYIYNQLSPTQVDPNDGNATEYRDGPFVSIYFGSVGENRDKAQQNTISLFGIYPVGGKYDDGEGGAATGTSGTGAAPYRFITYADRLYLEAELVHTGVIAGDARALTLAAIQESLKQVDYIVETYAGTAPKLYDEDPASASSVYIDEVMVDYDAAVPEKKLEILMTQKWISSFGSAVDAYTDYRRTGYPVMFDPNNSAQAPNGEVQPPINGDPVHPGAQEMVPVQLSISYPLTLPWYQTELEINPNAPPQKTNPGEYKPFWMP